MRDEHTGLFWVVLQGAGDLDAGVKLPSGGMEDQLKRIVPVFPYPAQDLLGVFFIYGLIGGSPNKDIISACVSL